MNLSDKLKLTLEIEILKSRTDLNEVSKIIAHSYLNGVLDGAMNISLEKIQENVKEFLQLK